jgi:hypothetical protein
MKPNYPLFAVDTCHWGFVVNNESDLGHFEQIDIEDQEYRCWDREGFPLQLTWTKKDGVGVSELPQPAEPMNLIAAIRKWAELENVAVEGGVRDPIELLRQMQAA